MRGYKGFESDFTCRGFQYEVGKEYEMDGYIEPCERGFHFCKTMAQVFNYYRGTDKRYAEVEAFGNVEEREDKCVTNKIRIIREIPHDEAVVMTNTGNRNTGDRNTGNRNTGDWNTGDWNTGNRNTGDRNTGDWNTGDWNTTDFSSGCFNTEPQKITLFNKPSEWTRRDWDNSRAAYVLYGMPQEIDVVEWVSAENMSDGEKAAHPEHETIGGYLKVTREPVNRQEWWRDLSADDRAEVLAIPNFDPDIFKEVTGIEVRSDAC